MPGVRDEGLLESALTRPENQRAYSEDSEDAFALAAAYAYGIAKNHPFNDGNKRTAWVAARTFLRLNGHAFDVDRNTGLERIVQLASGEVSQVDFADWLRKAAKE